MRSISFYILAGIAAALGLVLITAGPPAVHYFLTSVLIWAIFAVGFDLAFGVAGLLSFGHAAFFAAGGYSLALLTTGLGWPASAALPVAGLAGATLAGLVGTLALRLSGVYLGLTTLAAAQLFETVIAVRLRRYTGGMEGIVNVPRPSVFGYGLNDDRSYFLFVAAVFTCLMLGMAWLRRSHWGRALVALRLNEVRSQQLGFDTLRLKISAFAVSGFICGIAGALLAALMRFVNPELLSWTISGDVLIATLLGGAGTLWGPVMGALMVAGLRESLDGLTRHWHGILGIILILATLRMPEGLVPAIRNRLSQWRLR